MKNPINAKFKQIMTEYELKKADVVKILTSDYGSVNIRTIDSWLYNERSMPWPMLELLELKIRDILIDQQTNQD